MDGGNVIDDPSEYSGGYCPNLLVSIAVMGVLTLGSVQPVMAQDAAPAQTEPEQYGLAVEVIPIDLARPEAAHELFERVIIHFRLSLYSDNLPDIKWSSQSKDRSH